MLNLFVVSHSQWEHILQIILSGLLGAVIGFERERRKGLIFAGVRTYAAICIGSCVFGLISIVGSAETWPASDQTRIAAQVVSGIGFIGTGVIFRDGLHARGLTTAASLWVAAGIGLAVAFHLFIEAILATLLIFILLALSHFEWWNNFVNKQAKSMDVSQLDE